jgi:hypothetical protein
LERVLQVVTLRKLFWQRVEVRETYQRRSFLFISIPLQF